MFDSSNCATACALSMTDKNSMGNKLPILRGRCRFDSFGEEGEGGGSLDFDGDDLADEVFRSVEDGDVVCGGSANKL